MHTMDRKKLLIVPLKVDKAKVKESLLVEQSQEAENLHRNTDRRRAQVKKIVLARLGELDASTYDRFLETLIRLVTDLKETEQRIQLGEEQLIALNDNIPLITQ